VEGCVGRAVGGWDGSRARSASGRVARRGSPATKMTPFPVPGRNSMLVRVSAGGLPLMGAPALLSVDVNWRTPTRCGSLSWVSAGRSGPRHLKCAGFR
jgi:hypothetical protein